MADVAGIFFPCDDPVLKDIVEALLSLKYGARTIGGDAPRDPLRLPPLRIPKRKRSRQINLQGIRDAKRLQQQEEEAKKKAFSALVPYCNANGDCGTREGPKMKKASSAASKRARKDPMPECPKFVMHEAGPLKLIIRKLKEEKVTCDEEEDGRNRKRKIDDAGLAEEDMSFTKKVKLSASWPESQDFTQSEAAEACASASYSAQRAPFNPM